MTLQQNNQLQQKVEKTRTKRSVETGINETDFINTMFLRSTFFENGSDTNYFINPTLKTSQKLTYNDKWWYLDFLKDSYSTSVSYDKPSDKFMDLYKNGDNYVKEYNINKFYDVDKKQILRELTNFIYSFTNKYNLTQMLNKLKTNINVLQVVNLIEDNGKLINDYNSFEQNIDSHGYFVIGKNQNKEGKIVKFKHNIADVRKIGKVIYIHSIKFYDASGDLNGLYRGDGNNDPKIPEINSNTGKISKGNEKTDE